MSARLALRTALAIAVAGLVAGTAASASSSPSVSLDVIAWPGESSGPLEWKLWRVGSDEAMQTVTLHLPAGTVRPQALRALALTPQAESNPVGAAVTGVQAADELSTTRTPLVVGGCAGARNGELVTLRFETLRGCANVVFDGEALGTEVTTSMPADSAILRLDLRLDSLQTSGGRLLRANPEVPVTADTSASVRSATGEATVTTREIVGGATAVTISTDRSRIDYGGAVTVSGTVQRGGAPAAGERVVIRELTGTVETASGKQLGEMIASADGRFETSVRPTSTRSLVALTTGAQDGAGPRLNTLAGVSGEIVVRAPRPVVTKRRVRRLRGRRVRAVIVVRNPIARFETLQCRFYIGNRQVAVRRFPRGSAPLVFRVVARRNAKVWAVIGRWSSEPIAGRSSRPLRLLPTSARPRGSARSRRR